MKNKLIPALMMLALLGGMLSRNVTAAMVVVPVRVESRTCAPPKTGQNATAPIPAPARSDGALMQGRAWPKPRFTDNRDGTVTDHLTGLVWLKDANCLSDSKTWHEALDYVANEVWDQGGVESEDDCGLSDGSKRGDWRLPNVNELTSLVAWQYAWPALPNIEGTKQCNPPSWDCPFKNVVYLPPGTPYWTSTTFAKKPDEAWGVSFSGGGVAHMNKYTIRCFIWPVRDPR